VSGAAGRHDVFWVDPVSLFAAQDVNDSRGDDAGLARGPDVRRKSRRRLIVILLAITGRAVAAAPHPNEPAIVSVYPLGGQAGRTVSIEVRGVGLEGAYAVSFETPQIKGLVRTVRPAAPSSRYAIDDESAGSKKEEPAMLSAELEIHVAPGTPPGAYWFRLLAAQGVSNELFWLVSSSPVIEEMNTRHDRPESAQPVAIPCIVNGKISHPGESDYFRFEAEANQELTFEVVSRYADDVEIQENLLDAQLALYETRGSWFDPKRPVWPASNDDPISHFLSRDPRITYHFQRRGTYLIRVAGMLGQGGPESSYQLHIRTDAPEGPLPDPNFWERRRQAAISEHSFLRNLDTSRLRFLSARTVVPPEDSARLKPTIGIASERPGSAQSISSMPLPPIARFPKRERKDSASEVVTVPALIEGAIDNPGDVDFFRFRVVSGDRLAFEIETPDAIPPEFNPRLRILDSDHGAVVANIYRRIGRQFTFYLKTVEPKMLFSFDRGGEYTLSISDITGAVGNTRCRYRLLIRPQIPHLGDFRVFPAVINLAAGQAKKLTVVTEQEEGFSGDASIIIEGLPAGVTAVAGTEVVPDGGPALDEGPKERFVSKAQKAIVILTAESGVLATRSLRQIRILVRPIVDGVPGPLLLAREVPFMIVPTVKK
jgi:hypothetical protein